MVIQGKTENYICADGKFFVIFDYNDQGQPRYRQIESYLPAAPGTYGEPIEETMRKRLDAFEAGKDWRWAIGSTGGQLTARYQIRESDGELVSELSLSGGMKK